MWWKLTHRPNVAYTQFKEYACNTETHQRYVIVFYEGSLIFPVVSPIYFCNIISDLIYRSFNPNTKQLKLLHYSLLKPRLYWWFHKLSLCMWQVCISLLWYNCKIHYVIFCLTLRSCKFTNMAATNEMLSDILLYFALNIFGSKLWSCNKSHIFSSKTILWENM